VASVRYLLAGFFVLGEVDVLFVRSLRVFDPVKVLSELREYHAFMKRLSRRTKGYRLTAMLGSALTIGTLLILGSSLPIGAVKTLAALAMIFCVLYVALALKLLIRQLFSVRSKSETGSSPIGKP